MHHDLVDDHLREQRRGEREELDKQRGGQHLAPDALVPEQFGSKPAEAEFGSAGRGCGVVRRQGFRLGFVDEEQKLGFEQALRLGERDGPGCLLAGHKVQQALGVGFDQQGGTGCWRFVGGGFRRVCA